MTKFRTEYGWSEMEKLYAEHQMGKAEIKSNIGQIHCAPYHFLYIAELDRAPAGFPIKNVSPYGMADDRERFVGDLFDLSMTYVIQAVDPRKHTFYVAKSKNGKTNISRDVMDCVMKMLNRIPELRRDAHL